ncbi:MULTISPECIES: malonate decarboxylase holo-ACP synthase [unclassified Enterococcus]|uniref:malonate decarboxylase holo-ACP synthase n=1 Tax=unclassified Enterococcus TaxID=2608891 RepID=UPI0013EDACAB|nr:MULTISPECIES: malonate decarboxylase holo-ACP synthase [unclassified Enterococcus]
MIQAHDVVIFDKQVIEQQTLPEWLILSEKMYGTVRRALPKDPSQLGIGLRGFARNQRLALEIPMQAVQKVVHPWEIIDQESFRQSEIAQFPVYQQYHVARELLSGYKWGVGGSLGFELTTGIQAVKETSDFDLLIYADSPIGLPNAAIQSHPDFFEQFDTQVITSKGGFALKEYLRLPDKKILLKTAAGPELTREIW